MRDSTLLICLAVMAAALWTYDALLLLGAAS